MRSFKSDHVEMAIFYPNAIMQEIAHGPTSMHFFKLHIEVRAFLRLKETHL